MLKPRRRFIASFLSVCLFGGAGAISPAIAQEFSAPSFDISKGERSVNWYRPSTKESLNITYMKHGQWVPGAYDQLCYMLRDVQANQAVQMDVELIAILDWIQSFLQMHGYDGPIYIISGYRSPETNKKTPNAAKNSQHLFGTAADIRVPGVSSEYMGRLMRWLAVGGVGVYSGHNTFHVDTGRVRSWRG